MNAGVDDNNQSGSGISDRLEYAIDDTGNKLYVYNILPVNVMQKPSYLFKKVTSKLNSPDSWKCDDLMKVKSFNWGGLEDTDVSGIPSTYVMERTTTQKKLDGSTLSDYTDWFGDSRVDKVIDNIQNADNGKFGVYYSESRVASGNDPTTYDCDRISIISYANENTHPTDCFHSNYLTGLAFRGIYIPAKIYKGYTSAFVEAEGSLIEMTAADKVDFDTEKGEIYRYSPSNREEVRESEALYFSNYEALEAYRKDHPEDSAIETRFSAVGAPDENQLGFVCYYNLWLRHYNDEKADPHMSYPMEYATVRNNIYRVKVSFNGPGDPEPTMREPDTMQARIFVRKWNYREEETFYFD